MEGRPTRVRGGSWKRGGRGGNDGDSPGGEHRGRGRGSHNRGRSKRDHYRGRGRGGGAPAADFRHRDQDEGDSFEEEVERVEVFSRRKLESNWDRYEASERQKTDEDMPTQRGTDYHALLGSAGDSFTQFRFSEEKDWEMDSFAAGQLSAVFVDLPALAQSLQQVPLHQRLNLEAELVQVSTPVELPSVTLAPNQEKPKMSTFTPRSTALKGLSTHHKAPSPALGSDSQVSSSATEPVREREDDDDDDDDDDEEEELDQLLSLQKPVSGVLENQSVSVEDEGREVPEKAVKEVIEEKMEEVKDKDVKASQSVSVRQEVTEEDLEDWLDSMIS